MSAFTVHNAEITAWAASEAGRIQRGESEPYHAVLCDPPYGIAFMGKEWDDPGGPGAFQIQAKEWGTALLPLLYPGALVFMFAGTRMWHRLASGMEDAGFHLWDTLMWLHGQGFPKAQDISKLIDQKLGIERPVIGKQSTQIGSYLLSKEGPGPGGNKPAVKSRFTGDIVGGPASEQSAPWSGHKTAQLKPAWEPILCFRALDNGKGYAALALEYGSGALNVDAGRIGTELVIVHGYKGEDCMEAMKGKPVDGLPSYSAHEGRYPANLVLDEESAALLNEQSGILKSGVAIKEHLDGRVYNAHQSWGHKAKRGGNVSFQDNGGASRFFYCAKADTSERNAGLEIVNKHPTVKPIDLNRWLSAMLLPPDSIQPRRLLVPFSGVGSEMAGAMLAGWDEIVGVEQDAGYCEIANVRLAFWKLNAHLGEVKKVLESKEKPGQVTLFGTL